MNEISVLSKDSTNEILIDGISAVDKFINRNYLANLSEQEVLAFPDAEKRMNSIRLFQIEKLIYNEAENNNDKLISIYSAIQSIGATLVLLLRGDETGVRFYIGINAPQNVSIAAKTLEKSFLANFQGSCLKLKPNSETEKILKDCSFSEDACNVSSVTIVPSSRDEDKDKFVQGIEKFIDTMRGDEYSAIFLSRPVDKAELDNRKRGLEQLYSSLSPFAKTTMAYGENESLAVTEGITENFSHTVNNSISTTLGTNKSVSESTSKGKSMGFNLGFTFGTNTGTSTSTSSGTSNSKSTTTGDSDTTGSGTSKSDTKTVGTSKTLTLESTNKTIDLILQNIEEQLQRIKDCESFGLWETSAYFVAEEIQVSIVAANTFKALVSGETSNVENAYINIWNQHMPNTKELREYLRYCRHPLVLIKGSGAFNDQIVTPANYISGKELPMFVGLPQKSVSGVAVTSLAEFGRNVFTIDETSAKRTLPLGNIFHMSQKERSRVSLDIDSFTSHCFVSGSTGSGKSNTTYILLQEFYKKNIPFLVVEPAKGEYKNEFGNIPGINIFSTNPQYGQMLRLNPFWFDHKQIHLLEHLDRLIEIFNACWEMYAAMPAILKSGAERIYVDKGWDLLNSDYLGDGEPQFPIFADLLQVLPKIIKTSSYSADTQGDYTGALVTRVASLANGISGQIFCSNNAIDDSVLFDENTIVDLSRVGSMETKSLIMGILVMKLSEYRTAQATGSNKSLQHITVLEEAHNLLKRTGGAQGQETANVIGKSVEMISNSIAEMRTYGEGFIIVDQSPTAVDISAIKNTNTKIIMRLPEETDCEAIGNAMALKEEQIKELAKLPTGVAAVIQNNWLEAVLVKVDYARPIYRLDAEVIDKSALYRLRGEITNVLMEQYLGYRKFNKQKVEERIADVQISKNKKQEILSEAFALIDTIGEVRNIKAFCIGLYNISCCKGVFDIHNQMLEQVDVTFDSSEDFDMIRQWQSDITKSIQQIVHIRKDKLSLLVKLLIYANAKLSGLKYMQCYYALYEPDELKS